MKPMTRAGLFGALAASIVACTGSATVASSPATASSAVAATVHPSATAVTGARSAAATAISYYRAIETRNYMKAFSYIAARATGPDGRRLTWRTFSQLAAVMDRGEGRVTSFTMSVFPALTVVTIYRQRVGPYHTHLRLTRAGNSWVITAIDRI